MSTLSPQVAPSHATIQNIEFLSHNILEVNLTFHHLLCTIHYHTLCIAYVISFQSELTISVTFGTGSIKATLTPTLVILIPNFIGLVVSMSNY